MNKKVILKNSVFKNAVVEGALIKDVVKDVIYNGLCNAKNLFYKALFAASIYWSGVNMIAESSIFLPNHSSVDTIIVHQYSNRIVSNHNAINVDTFSLNVDTLSSKVNSLDTIVALYAHVSKSIFVDNDYYKKLRVNDAIKQLQKYNLQKESTVMVVNKTFQKAMMVKLEMQPYIYSKDSIDSFKKQARNFKISKNDYDKLVEMVLEPEILLETDCSTAKVYGRKICDGDSKTPEGIFTIYSVEDSHDWTYNGLWAYGPKFFRIQNAIGIHGNGTDTTKHSFSSKDNRYMKPEPLGVYANNFAQGLSHGCIRLENEVIDELIKDGLLKNGTKIIIFENKELTEVLSKYYLNENLQTINNANREL